MKRSFQCHDLVELGESASTYASSSTTNASLSRCTRVKRGKWDGDFDLCHTPPSMGFHSPQSSTSPLLILVPAATSPQLDAFDDEEAFDDLFDPPSPILLSSCPSVPPSSPPSHGPGLQRAPAGCCYNYGCVDGFSLESFHPASSSTKFINLSTSKCRQSPAKISHHAGSLCMDTRRRVLHHPTSRLRDLNLQFDLLCLEGAIPLPSCV